MSEFKKDDYVTVISDDATSVNGHKMVGWCFRLKNPYPHGTTVNCNVGDADFSFRNFDGGYNIKLSCVRKATEVEIAKYKEIGKPYNTKLVTFSHSGDIYISPNSSRSDIIWCEVVKDMTADEVYANSGCSGSLPSIIRKGSFMWFVRGENIAQVKNLYGNVYPEANRYGANVPHSYFKVVDYNPHLSSRDTDEDKWCVQMTSSNAKVIGKFFNEQSNNVCYTEYIYGYIHSYNHSNQCITKKGKLNAAFHDNNPRSGFKVISYETFVSTILSKFPEYNSIKSSSSKSEDSIYIKELIAEAKRRYPPGTKFNPRETPDGKSSTVVYTVKEGYEPVYYASDDCLCLNGNIYVKGFWADIVKDPENAAESDLVAEARRRYPLGTKFYPAHVSKRISEFCIITSDSEFKKEGCIITARIEGANWVSSTKTEYGNTNLNRVVYSDGKWAEIAVTSKIEDNPRFEDLLVEANRKFPLGSTVKCDIGGFNKIFVRQSTLDFNSKDTISASGEPWVYYKGEWAELVKQVEPEEESHKLGFRVGGWVKVTTRGSHRGIQYWEGDFFRIEKIGERCIHTTKKGNDDGYVQLYFTECQWAGMDSPLDHPSCSQEPLVKSKSSNLLEETEYSRSVFNQKLEIKSKVKPIKKQLKLN